jgi:hypothetical protein
MKNITIIVVVLAVFCACDDKQMPEERIDRTALLSRNSPQIRQFDTLASLTVGNGEFAVTVDASGLQTFPSNYAKGVPLGTQSQWGWHRFDNPSDLRHEESWQAFDFGRGKSELYAVQFADNGRQRDAAEWFRINPHRLHLGVIGLELDENAGFEAFTDIQQTLELERGVIHSRYHLNGVPVKIRTSVHPQHDMVAAEIISTLKPAIKIHFPYPTGGHSDDACDWNRNDKHHTEIVSETFSSALLKRTVDHTIYFVSVQWEGKAKLMEKEANYFVIRPEDEKFAFTCLFTPTQPVATDTLVDAGKSPLTSTQLAAADTLVDTGNSLFFPTHPTVAETFVEAEKYWHDFWYRGAVVDFCRCTDPRARELERRVVLSQYLLAVQCAGSSPPQETGLTYNSWYGKFHLEMIWWHQAQFALWNRPELLARTMDWYEKVEPVARHIAEKQEFKGIRWMKMTDLSGIEAPSIVGNFLIWQ